MKKTKSFFALLVFLLVLFITVITNQIFYISAYANETSEKVYSHISLDDHFIDDSIIVTLDKNASLSFSNYTINDFSEIDCVSVINLMEKTENLAKKHFNAKKTKNWKGLEKYVDRGMLVDTENYHTILMLKLRKPGKKNVIKAIKSLNKRKDIIRAEPDYIQTIQATHPNDENLQSQWSLNSIGAENAWNFSTGSAETLVGVIDSGIDGAHPDLKNRIKSELCADFTTKNGLGIETTTMTPNPTDIQGHGTHVAGIIGAQGVDNGISGIVWNTRIVSLRVFNPTAPSSRVIKAIDYTIKNNIPILNYSGGGKNQYTTAQQSSISNYPGLLILSAGNESANNDEIGHYPSNYLSE